jgi:WD40 repeat protein
VAGYDVPVDSPHRGHAFISYVREDSDEVDELQHMLEAAGVPVWRDTASLWPGEDWHSKIRDAITRDALVFIACFSNHGAARRKSYMNEELLLAVDQLRLRQPDDPWLIPVRFDDCPIPDFELGPIRTLASIHRADLFGSDHDRAAARLIAAVQRLLRRPPEGFTVNRPRRNTLRTEAAKLEEKRTYAGPQVVKTVQGSDYQNLTAAGAIAPVHAERTSRHSAASTLPELPSHQNALVLPTRMTRTLKGHTNAVYGVAFSPDGRLLATTSYDMVRLWEPITGEHLRTLTCKDGEVYVAAFSPDGRVLATGSHYFRVQLWDPTNGEHLRTLTFPIGPLLVGVAFSPDGRLLAVNSYDEHSASLWDPATGEHLRTLTGHASSVAGVAFSPDGRLLATTSYDKTVRLWDPTSGEHLRTLGGHTSGVYGVAFSPDGQLLATASSDETARLWDPATGRHLALTGHGDEVQGVAFSPDGRVLATASQDKTVRLWDPATGEHLQTLTGHTAPVWGVAFSPDGRLLATASWDKTARLWNHPGPAEAQSL